MQPPFAGFHSVTWVGAGSTALSSVTPRSGISFCIFLLFGDPACFSLQSSASGDTSLLGNIWKLFYIACFPLLTHMDHVPPISFFLCAAHMCSTKLWENTRPALTAALNIISLPGLCHLCSASVSQPLGSWREQKDNSSNCTSSSSMLFCGPCLPICLVRHEDSFSLLLQSVVRKKAQILLLCPYLVETVPLLLDSWE